MLKRMIEEAIEYAYKQKINDHTKPSEIIRKFLEVKYKIQNIPANPQEFWNWVHKVLSI